MDSAAPAATEVPASVHVGLTRTSGTACDEGPNRSGRLSEPPGGRRDCCFLAIDALELAPRARTGRYEPTVAAENRLRVRATRGEGSRAQMRLEVGAVIPIHPCAGVVPPRRGAVEDRERARAVRRQRVRELVRAGNDQRGNQVGVAGAGRVDAHVDRGAGAPIGALRDVADGEFVSPARL